MSDAGKPLKNTHNIKAALDGIFHQRTDGAKAKIDIPQKQYGNHIPEDVFSAVDLSDLVVADISTGNVNAVYELGVRHALRPHTTIIMIEDKAAFSFDLNHVATFTYTHLGEDIGSREAEEKKAALTSLIAEIMRAPKRDSPVYEFLRGLREPSMSEEDYAAMLQLIEDSSDRLQGYLADARAAEAKEDFVAAAEGFRKALEIIESPRPQTPGGEDQQNAIGQTEQGLAEARRATDIHRRLAAADPNSSDMKQELASDYNREATLQAKLGLRDAALANQALDRFTDVVWVDAVELQAAR